MSYIIRAYCGDYIKSADLSENSEITIGSDSGDSISFTANKLTKSQITITKSGSGYVIKGKHMYNSEGSRVSSDVLEEGKRYLIECEPAITLSVHPKQADGKTMLGIYNIRELTIGRSRKNDIMLTHMKTSGRHCAIVKKDGLYKIKDLDSSNGTFVNGKRILREKVLNDGDVINISVYQIKFENNALMFYNVGNDIDIAEDIERLAENEQGGEVLKKTNDGGTISMFKIENKYKVASQNNGTISMFDVNINVNIDNKE